MVVFNEEKQTKTVNELHEKEEEELARILSQKYGISYIDLSKVSISPDVLQAVPEEKARGALLAPFRKKGETLHVAVHSPNKEETRYAVSELERQDFRVILYMASTASLERAWKLYKNKNFVAEKSGIIEVSNDEIEKITKKINNLDSLKEYIENIVEEGGRESTSRILEVVFGGALATHSSDVHIEPEEGSVRLRLRLDGILQDIYFFDESVYRLLLSRIKLVSGLKLNVRDQAQDGRFTFTIQGRQIGVRTSVIPGSYGESIVMRLLDPKMISVPLAELGINERLFKIINREIEKPNGLILNTGPTGSGKTTSLYACLNKIYSPQMKIITIENPIEYHLEGIVQTQVDNKRGYTFLEGLRSALRQDPDVIMIGEIRDLETARTAINSALTGHLVLSTLHTNNAAGTIPRLIDLGVNSKIISSALTLSLAQRLVRKLCNSCKEEDRQNENEASIIERILSGIVVDPPKNNGKIWRSKGCKACNNTGYKGRAPVMEGINMDKKIENVIQNNPSEREIIAAAKEQGILTMSQDGVLKVLDGITTLTEVQRVVDLFEED
jgi:type IV pilus assembly protein PilB